MPEQNEHCTFCGHSHPEISADLPNGRLDWGHPGREGIPTRVGHIPCPTCNNYHDTDEEHTPCDTCGEIHSDTRPSSPQHGPLRHCEHCDGFVDRPHADNWEQYHDEEHWRDEGFHDSRGPRSEEELAWQEPQRVAGINSRLAKVVALHDARVADSPYFVKHSPAGTYLGQYNHVVQVYHKNDPNTRVGYLAYDDRGEVGGMYVDHRHQGTLAATQMLVAAHRHLKDTVGQPIGLLRATSTTEQSAGLIKKIDPESTYLRHDSADSGRARNYKDQQDEINNVPLRNDSLRKTNNEWEETSQKSGRTVGQLMAMSYDQQNRNDSTHYIYYEPDSPEKAEALALRDKLDASQAKERFGTRKREDAALGNAAANLIASRVHTVPGDMPVDFGERPDPFHWIHDFDLHDSLPGSYSKEELEKSFPPEIAERMANLRMSSLSAGVGRAKPTYPNRRKDANNAFSDKMNSNERKNAVEGGADLIGTSGVWTGDEETDAKAENQSSTLPLDLNPYERVKRIMNPLGKIDYVRGD